MRPSYPGGPFASSPAMSPRYPAGMPYGYPPMMTPYGYSPMMMPYGYSSGMPGYSSPSYSQDDTGSSATMSSVTPYSNSPGYSPAPAYGAPASGEVTAVQLLDNEFMPAEQYVRAGTTVRWENLGFHHHSVASSQGLFDSGPLDHGGSFSYTFRWPGTYAYFCRFHAQMMRGTVVVMP